MPKRIIALACLLACLSVSVFGQQPPLPAPSPDPIGETMIEPRDHDLCNAYLSLVLDRMADIIRIDGIIADLRSDTTRNYSSLISGLIIDRQIAESQLAAAFAGWMVCEFGV